MRALKCDICQNFFDPAEQEKLFEQRGEEPINRIAFCQSDDTGHTIKEVVDVCSDCVTKMLESVNYFIIPDWKKEKFRNGGSLNGNQV